MGIGLTSPDDRAGEIDSALGTGVTVRLVNVADSLDMTEHPDEDAVYSALAMNQLTVLSRRTLCQTTQYAGD